MQDVKQIFARQYKRLENCLKEANCPQLYLDAFSKYFKFCEEDILNLIKENGDELSKQYQNFNR